MRSVSGPLGAVKPRVRGAAGRVRPRVVALGLALGVASSCGGEVEVARLTIRPSFEAWQDTIQPLFREMGCAVNGACHGDDFRGEVRITGAPDGEALYADYLSVKATVNVAEPERSPLLVRLLRGGPGANHFPPCFDAVDSCAWRKVVAWIGDDGTGPGPADIDCDASEEVCRP